MVKKSKIKAVWSRFAVWSLILTLLGFASLVIGILSVPGGPSDAGAVAGIMVLVVIFLLAGLILAIVGLFRIKRLRQRGIWLSIASIVLSGLYLILLLLENL